MKTAQLRQKVLAMSRLPVQLSVAAAVITKPATAITARLLAQDPVIAARVIGVAKLPQLLQDAPLEEALGRLGAPRVQQIVLDLAFAAASSHAADPSPFLRHLWRHCAVAAAYAGHIAARSGTVPAPMAHAAGLLHDMGKLVLENVSSDSYEQARDKALARSVPVMEEERARFGASHTLAGKWLAEAWGLPEPLVHAMWLHHQPAHRLHETPGDTPLINILRLANAMAHASAAGRRSVEGLIGGRLTQSVNLSSEDLLSTIENTERDLSQWLDDTEWGKRPSQSWQDLLGHALGHMNAGSDTSGQELAHLRAQNAFRKAIDSARTLEDAAAAAAQEAAKQCGGGQSLCVITTTQGSEYIVAPWSGSQLTAQIAYAYKSGDKLTGLESFAEANCAVVRAILCGDSLAQSWRSAPIQWQGDQIAWIAVRNTEALVSPNTLDAIAEAAGPPLATRVTLQRTQALAESFGETLTTSETYAVSDSPPSPSLDNQDLATESAEQDSTPDEDAAPFEALAAAMAQSLHDPLAVIAGHATILMDHAEDAEERRALRAILDESHQGKQVLETVLAYAQPTEAHRAPALINYVLRRVMTDHGDRLRGKGIRVDEEYAEGLPRIAIDRRQFEQAVLALLANAEEAMTRTGGVFTLRTGHTLDHSGVQIEFSNTGSPIPPGQAARIFDPFFTTKNDTKHLGLGLAVSRAVIASHGGTIDVTEGAANETTFTIVLPKTSEVAGQPSREHGGEDQPSLPSAPPGVLEEAAMLLSEVPAAEAKDSEDADESRQSLHDKPIVIIVDDDEDLREVLKETMKLGGYEAVAAASMTDVFHERTDRHADLILLGLAMPMIDGQATLTALRRHYANVPVILMSSGLTNEEVQTLVDWGARACLAKPFQIRHLLAEVAGAVAG
jgi:signal transduction histidine kinase/HD-like signal output (HDOD) protein